jgi:hypothetical protein
MTMTIKLEELLLTPHIGAVVGHKDGEIANQANP